MPPREKGTRSWRADPETTAASGGHLPPEVDTASPLFDPLFDPITPPAPPDNPSSWLNDDGGSPTETLQRPLPDERSAPSPRTRRALRKPRPTVRRVRRTLKRVSPLTVLKLSLFYYLLFLFVWLAIVAVTYWFLESTDFFNAFKEVTDIFYPQWKDVEFSLALFEKWALFIGVILVVVGSLINAFLAFLYNLAADIFGGIEMTFVERDV